MSKIKKGDTVFVITGKDKGRSGQVLNVNAETNKITVSGINTVKKHVKPNPDKQQEGGILSVEKPLNISNVKLEGGKVGYRLDKDGKKERFFKKTGEVVLSGVVNV